MNTFRRSARSVTDALAQDFMASDELLLPILNILAQCTRTLYATRNIWCFLFVCNSRIRHSLNISQRTQCASITKINRLVL